jgi:Skp family chaperone for outer membrane proteins
MRRMKLPLSMAIAVMTAWLVPATLMAQDIKIGVIDMERAMVQTIEGKKAEAAFTAKFDSLRKVIEAKQQQITDAQNKLKTQDRLLADAAKTTLTKDVERWQTELARLQEDSQKELDGMRAEVMKPIAQVAEAVVNGYAAENGYSLILDLSNPQNESIVWFNPKADVTNEVTKLIDVEMVRAAAAAKKPAPR